MVVNVKFLGDRPRVSEVVRADVIAEVSGAETDRVGGHVACHGGHLRDDCARIDAATQKASERNIGDHLAPHRRADDTSDARNPLAI